MPAPPDEFENSASRYSGWSASYFLLVVSVHVPGATGSDWRSVHAASYAPGDTTPGAVRANANCSAAIRASSPSALGLPCDMRTRSRNWTFLASVVAAVMLGTPLDAAPATSEAAATAMPTGKRRRWDTFMQTLSHATGSSSHANPPLRGERDATGK